MLLSEEEIRRLVARYLGEAGRARPDDELDWKSLSTASAVCQLAIALRDPRLYEEATALRRGGLNDLKRIDVDVAQRYLEFGDPETALAKLSEMAEAKRLQNLDLFAECYRRLGRRDEPVTMRDSCRNSGSGMGGSRGFGGGWRTSSGRGERRRDCRSRA